MNFFRNLYGALFDIVYGPPCPRHPDHRTAEYSPFSIDYPVRCCVECYKDWERIELARLHALAAAHKK